MISLKQYLRFPLLYIIFTILIPVTIQAESCDSLVYDLNQPINLETGWKFRKGDNLDWKEIQVEESFWLPRTIPDYGISKTENISGYHWYRCKITLPENYITPKEPLGIRLGKLRDVDEAFFNNQSIGRTGNLVPTKELDFHKIRIYPIPTKLWQVGDNIISIRLFASGTQQGLKSIPRIDTEKNLIEKLYSENFLAVGFGYIFILMGIYFLMGSFIRGLLRENTFFGLFSVLIGIYTLIRSQYRYELFDSFMNSYTVELLVLIPLPILFINFLIAHLDVRRNYLVYLNEGILAVLFCLTPFVKSTNYWNLIIKIFNYTLPLSVGIVAYYIYKNYKLNLNKLKYILIGLIGLVPTVIVDSLSAIEVINMDGTIYFGFFFFLVLISVQLSEEMISNLQRFIELEAELIRMERIKTRFLLNISGEFKSGVEKISSIIKNIKMNPSLLFDKNFNQSSRQSKSKSTKSKAKPKIISKFSGKESLEILDSMVFTTLSMIEEAVLLRKLDNNQYFLELSNFNIIDLIRDTISLIEKKTEQTRGNLFLNIYPDEPIVHSDKILLTAIIRNLIENALQYTDKSVRVDIDFQINSNGYTFSVSDEGIGMSIFEQENLFKKFIRGTKNDHIPGAGIGLTLCKRAALALGGDIKVKSSEGLGTIFTVTIPVGKK